MNAPQWSVFLAGLDPVRGSEQGGNRPVLIVSNDNFNELTSNVTVLPLTSTQRRLYPAEVLLPRRLAGQQHDSIVMAHQIRTIAKERLLKVIGHLQDQTLQQAIQGAIIQHLRLD